MYVNCISICFCICICMFIWICIWICMCICMFICICICICASLYTLRLRRVRLHCGFFCLVSSSSTSSLFIFSAEFWLQTIFNFIAFPSTHPPFLFQFFLLVFFVLQKNSCAWQRQRQRRWRRSCSDWATATAASAAVRKFASLCGGIWGTVGRNLTVWGGGIEELWGVSASVWISFCFIYSLCFCFSL